MKRAIVAGGAGFIGSHFVDKLMEQGSSIIVVDDLSSGRRGNLRRWSRSRRLTFLERDLRQQVLWTDIPGSADLLLYLAANPEVRAAEENPRKYAQDHLKITRNILELAKQKDVSTLAFASSSTVYGDAEKVPTPETYGPLNPISAYGQMKLDCERVLSEEAVSSGLRVLILRYANIIGPRSRHGVIYDLAKKLVSNAKELEVLGDGTQCKSYLHVADCVEASLTGMRSMLSTHENPRVLNVGNVDWIKVSRIAEIVAEAMGLPRVRLKYKPASSDGRGWKGDVKQMLLDISRLEELGWKPKYSSEEAVRLTANSVAAGLEVSSQPKS